MNVQTPDYQNCIANLACSILNHYGITPPNPTLPAADRLLAAHPLKHVVVLLLDGMGISNMEKHLASDGFFRSHMVTAYSSTFPPTTVAATTAMLSGLTPNQSSWLGWTGYFPQVDRNLIYFFNVDDDTGEEVTECNVPWTYLPYQNLVQQISAKGTAAYNIAPFAPPFPKDYDTIAAEVETLCRKDEKSYIYAYWNEPDHTMHQLGVDDEAIGQLMRDLEKRTEEMAARLQDTLLIITADHGHINTKPVNLREYPDICQCLVRMPSIELRAVNFFVKDGMQDAFEQAFQKHFGSDFWLLPMEKVLEMQLFGKGESHPCLRGMLGDYLAIAIGGLDLCNVASEHKGSHAGLTPPEMTIPLMAVALP